MAHAYVEETRLSAGINGQLAALGRFNSLPYVRELGAPTLVVHGEEDQVLPFGVLQQRCAPGGGGGGLPYILLKPNHFFHYSR